MARRTTRYQRYRLCSGVCRVAKNRESEERTTRDAQNALLNKAYERVQAVGALGCAACGTTNRTKNFHGAVPPKRNNKGRASYRGGEYSRADVEVASNINARRRSCQELLEKIFSRRALRVLAALTRRFFITQTR